MTCHRCHSVCPCEKQYRVPLERIMAVFCERAKQAERLLRGRSRAQFISQLRHVAIFLMREISGASFPMLGSFWNNRDHSTMIHAVRQGRRLVGQQAYFSDLYQKCERELLNHVGDGANIGRAA